MVAGSPDDPKPTTMRLRIVGRVQGVGYRAWTVQTARRLGLTGWVRNLADGSVEALAWGSKEAIEALVTAAHAGPPSARVLEVTTTPEDPGASLPPGFHQAPTERPKDGL